MTDRATSGHVFLPTARTGPAWSIALEQMARPQDAEIPWERGREEMAVRDLFTRFTYALDQCDVDGMMQFFTDDCLMTNPRGTFSGAEAVRADLNEQHRKEDPRLHLWSNAVVRLSDDYHTGTVTSYFLAIVQRAEEPARWVGGLRADKVVKRNEVWRICEFTATVDFTAAVVPVEE